MHVLGLEVRLGFRYAARFHVLLMFVGFKSKHHLCSDNMVKLLKRPSAADGFVSVMKKPSKHRSLARSDSMMSNADSVATGDYAHLTGRLKRPDICHSVRCKDCGVSVLAEKVEEQGLGYRCRWCRSPKTKEEWRDRDAGDLATDTEDI